jgi:gelsolin
VPHVVIIYRTFYQAAPSLNSSYCYILHDGDMVFTWIGNLSSSVDQDLAERQLDVIKVQIIRNALEYNHFMWIMLR